MLKRWDAVGPSGHLAVFSHPEPPSESACTLPVQFDLQTAMHMLLLNPATD